ncbi:MAG: hypothetical protein H6574_14380 [Lewinellaceae bacterium]|nr:hypothetical protein [Lewinellaceae bacterium]
MSIDSVLGDRYNLVELGSTRQLVVSSQVEPSSDKAVLFGGIRYDADSTAILGLLPNSTPRLLRVAVHCTFPT